MNQIRQHIPGFVDGIEPAEATFSTLDELLSVPFVARFREIVDPGKPFHRFSYSEDGNLLMAEYDEGRSWWVVGYLREAVDGLPNWEPVRG